MNDIKEYSTRKDKLSAFFGQEILNHYGVKRTFRKGTVIFKEGEKGDYLFIIRSGKVKIFHMKNDRETIVAKLGEGSIVGEMAVMTGKPRTASVEVLEDMEAYVIDSESLFNIFKDHPQIREIIGVESIKREEENIQKLLEDE